MDIQQTPNSDPMHITTVVLSRKQILFLDEICAQIRRNTGFASRRSAVIRALIEGFSRSGLKFNTTRTEQEMVNALEGLFRRGADRR